MSNEETPRPRAQYGEYASPEEQQRARGIPDPVSGGGHDGFTGGHPPVMPQSNAAALGPYPSAPAPAAQAGAAKRSRPVDRVITLVLLAIGLLFLLNGIPGYLALPQAMQTVYDQLGAGTYPAGDVAASLGVTALVVQVVIWVATAATSWAVMRRGNLSWWIALLGGVLAFIATMVIVSIALFADPGFINNVTPENLP